ncbi:MAG: UbiD family decarboxylase [Candidatus Tectomicrobia bacterium]|nr:UbiD family decarboxylase [Candidatus Tectomicrobia bacterium]
MAYRDIRAHLAALEARGKLRRIRKSVDLTWELACLARWMFQALPDGERFGLLFERVRGYDIPVMTGVLGASRETYAIALETEPEEINEKWVRALLHPIPPQEVRSAPCQEVVLRGEEADLGRLPIPIWTPGKDAAPYVTTIVISRDGDTGVQNAATYRTMVQDGRHLVINLTPGRHGTLCYESWVRKGKPAPFAWVIGAEPAAHLAAVCNVPYGTDEMAVAGGLKGAPVEVVKAKTGDLWVPAHAEIVIEGELRPGEFAEEGRFGEFAGYMGPVARKPRVHVRAVTHRKDPLYYGYISQMPPSESTVIQSLSNAGLILKMLRHDLGHNTVQDAHIDLTYGGLLAHGIISMKPLYPGHAKRVGRLVAEATLLKRITVVDEDIDIRDPMHLDWAMNARFNAARDTIIIDDVYTPAVLDPTVRIRNGEPEMSSKLILDATEKEDAGDLSLPPRELMMKALEVWKEVGLPEFEIPKRVRSFLDRHS